MNKSTIRRFVIATATVVFAVFGLTACSEGATSSDQKVAEDQLGQYQKAQPAPRFDWSQYRETLISVETAQVNGTATTTFFFNQGVERPTKVCSSIGYAIASTAQLTNPMKYYASGVTLPQIENNGVFTGDSSGTYAVCLINGKPAPVYWEGFVHTEPGKAHWDAQKGIVNDGDPSFVVKTK